MDNNWKKNLEESYKEATDGRDKWNIIKAFVDTLDEREVYSDKSDSFKRYALKMLEYRKKNHMYAELVWHYIFRRIPAISRIGGVLLKRNKEKEYYTYKTWYYEYLENVVHVILDIRENSAQYEKIFTLLDDEKSRVIFCDILMGRIMESDDYYIAAHNLSGYTQYFDFDIVHLEDGMVFADCGGYIGDTSEEFIGHMQSQGKNCKTYIYEPDKENMEKVRENLSKYEQSVVYKPYAVSNNNRLVNFNLSGGSSGSICSMENKVIDSKFTVQAVSLDEDIKERVSFIKMDIEGEESKAIDGVANHIRNEHPICAICVYHKYQDIWRLPLQVLHYNSDYKLFIRHYDNNFMESVMYFVS
jgi:FkbM family methyltransferase